MAFHLRFSTPIRVCCRHPLRASYFAARFLFVVLCLCAACCLLFWSLSSGTPQRSVPYVKTEKRDCGELQFHTRDKDLEVFKPAVTDNSLCLLMDTVAALCSALTKASITYFLYEGTLVGSWRHHGLVPWDDDVDIAVDFTRQTELRQALNTLKPKFQFTERQRVSWKFYAESAGAISAQPWRWPFVDICFFDESPTHVFEHDLDMFPEFVFPKEWIFPTVLRPFGRLMLAAPRRTRNVLDLTYNLDECVISHYSHRTEMGKDESEVDSVLCDELSTVYPFVEHESLGTAGCNETLVMNGSVLSWLLLDGFQC